LHVLAVLPSEMDVQMAPFGHPSISILGVAEHETSFASVNALTHTCVMGLHICDGKQASAETAHEPLKEMAWHMPPIHAWFTAHSEFPPHAPLRGVVQKLALQIRFPLHWFVVVQESP